MLKEKVVIFIYIYKQTLIFLSHISFIFYFLQPPEPPASCFASVLRATCNKPQRTFCILSHTCISDICMGLGTQVSAQELFGSRSSSPPREHPPPESETPPPPKPREHSPPREHPPPPISSSAASTSASSSSTRAQRPTSNLERFARLLGRGT
jgi:hypothetical protein